MVKSSDYLIVGSGIAGFTAARAIRERDPKGSIAMLSEEPVSFYSKVLLVNYLRGKVDREKLFLVKPEWFEENKVDVHLDVIASGIDIKEKKVFTAEGNEYGYKKLLIATGVRPRKISATGEDQVGIIYLWDLRDAEKLSSAIEELKKQPREKQKAMVIGGGFICQTFLKIFKDHGIETHLLMRGGWYWSRFLSEPAGKLLEEKFLENDIILHKDERVKEFVRQNDGVLIKTEKGSEIEAGLILAGVGVEPNAAWLVGSGIEIKNGIVVDEHMKTNVPGIFAAGDVVNFYDPILEDYHCQGNWTNASRQGEVAGKNMAGGRAKYEEITAFTVDVFGLAIIFLGEYDRLMADEVIVRSSEQEKSVREFYFKDGRLIGAALVNAVADRPLLEAAIKGKIKLNKQERLDLAEWSIPLNKSKLYGVG